MTVAGSAGPVGARTSVTPMPSPPGEPVVLVTPRSFSSGKLRLHEELTAAGYDVRSGPADHDLRALGPLLSHAVAWIAGTGPVTAAHFAAAPELRVLARYGVGTDAVDLAAADAHGVVVCNTPGANTAAVAEHALALMLAALRDVPAADRAVRVGDRTVHRTREVGESTVGIVGLGRIGRRVAQLLTGFGSRILAADPYVDPADLAGTGIELVELVELDELMQNADLVTLHAPGDAVVVDERRLALVRPGSILVNTARAGLVEESAVAAALRDGRLRSYAADVLGDGAVPAGPLLDPELRDRTVFTPHAAAQTVEAVDLMGRGSVDAVLAVLDDRPPRHVVRPSSGAA